MATIAEQLESIKASKAAIKGAIQAKGVSCGDVLSDYANRIAAIPTANGEETKTIDITSNGTFEVTPSAANKVLSKVVVNANVESLGFLSMIDTFTQQDNGIYKCVFEDMTLPTNGGAIEVLALFGQSQSDIFTPLGLTLDKSQSGYVEVGATGVEHIYVYGKRGIPFNFCFVTGDPAQGYVSGILWHYPGSGYAFYGQKF